MRLIVPAFPHGQAQLPIGDHRLAVLTHLALALLLAPHTLDTLCCLHTTREGTHDAL